MLALTPPVDSPPIHRFAYVAPFRANQHRGLDFATTRGTPVRAPCTGRFTFTGTLPSGPALTLRCQSFTVTLLGIERGRRHGERTRTGTTIGHATGHELHLGVRRTNDRFGYVDPEPLLRDSQAPPSAPPAAAPRHGPRPPAPRRAPPAAPAPAPARSTPRAPWPAWLGVAFLLAGAAGLRARRGRRVGPWHALSTSKSSRPIPRRWRGSTSARSAGR